MEIKLTAKCLLKAKIFSSHKFETFCLIPLKIEVSLALEHEVKGGINDLTQAESFWRKGKVIMTIESR